MTSEDAADLHRAAGDDRAAQPASWLGNARQFVVAPQLDIAALDAVEGVPRLAVQLLHNRGVTTPEAMRSLLRDDPAADEETTPLPDVDLAVDRILRARDAGERVAVWGDFDCDGMTSCALLIEALRAVGLDATPYVATRDDDGRGLNVEGLESLARDGVGLVVTTDCGSSNVEEVALAVRLGMDVVVSDHHPLHGETARPLALVNPRRDGADARDADLAGVGVAFRLAQRLLVRAIGAPAAAAACEALLDLVAVGTVADVVPLTRQNWRLVRAGLARLNTSPRAGLAALMRAASLGLGGLTSRDVSFALAPRLNACGRLGEPLLGVRLLIAHDATEAESLVRQVETLHQRRQGMTEELYSRVRRLALERAARQSTETAAKVLVAVDDGLPLGLIGLAAGRLADDLGRPVFVVSRNGQESRGSGRAPAGGDLGALLATRADLFVRFGGHAQAAGFTVANDRLEEALAFLDTATPVSASRASQLAADEGLASEGVATASPSATTVDCRLPLRRVVRDNVQSVRLLEPYGPGFPEPVFVAPAVRLVDVWKSGMDGRTLRLRVREGSMERAVLWPKHGHLRDAIARQLPVLPPVAMVYSLATSRTSDYSLRALAFLPGES